MCESCGNHGDGSGHQFDQTSPTGKIDSQGWIWAYVQKTPEGDSLLALVDASGQPFVPVFNSKETGLINQGRLPADTGAVELQAMVKADVVGLAKQGDFRVVLVNQAGKVDQVLNENA